MLQGERELASDNRSPPASRFPSRRCRRACRASGDVLVDANGILSVTATDMRTGIERSVDVKPSYGLTDEEIERMLESRSTRRGGRAPAPAARGPGRGGDHPPRDA
jgi:molecular chaperone DnaK (HSP70)